MEKLSFNYPYLFSYLDFFVPSTKGRTKKDILFLSYPKKRLIDGSDIGKTGLMTNIHNGKIRRKKKLFCLFSHGILYIILKRHPHMLFISSNRAAKESLCIQDPMSRNMLSGPPLPFSFLFPCILPGSRNSCRSNSAQYRCQ